MNEKYINLYKLKKAEKILKENKLSTTALKAKINVEDIKLKELKKEYGNN
jgi:hypothetical protein